MLMDYHMHTTFSPDAKDSLETMVAAAERMGFEEIAITDHVDIASEGAAEGRWTVDPVAYSEAIDAVRHRHPGITVRKGLELGDTPETRERVRDVAEKAGLDFALLSTHMVDGVDPYFSDAFFAPERTRADAYGAYVRAVRRSVEGFGSFSSVAHLGYAAKYAPYEDQPLVWEDAREDINAILRRIAEAGGALEVNTSGYGVMGVPIPTPSILKRYKELGGAFVTLGSDAHSAAGIGRCFKEARELLLSMGFRHTLSFDRLCPAVREL